MTALTEIASVLPGYTVEDLLDHSLDWIMVMYTKSSRVIVERLQGQAIMMRMDNEKLINVTKRHEERQGKIAQAVNIMAMPGWGYNKGSK